MDGGEIIGLLAVLGIFVIPSIGLTARFAFKPIVESLIRLRESFDRQGTSIDQQRLNLLEQRMTEMQESLERLSESVEFDHQLRASNAPASLPGAPTR